jgi:hypothetical protein
MKRRILWRLVSDVILLALVALLAFVLWSTHATGKFEGTLTHDGVPMAGYWITLSKPEMRDGDVVLHGSERSQRLTDDKGFFVFDRMQPGEYFFSFPVRISASRICWASEIITVEAGKTHTREFSFTGAALIEGNSGTIPGDTPLPLICED